MKTIILSAGKGVRLLPLTKDRPKILVELGDGTTLLSRQAEKFFRHPEVKEIIVGAGHCAEKVEEFAEGVKDKGEMTVVYNPFYGISGPLVTLWVVLNKIDDAGFMFINGDTLYSEAVYAEIARLFSASKEGIYLLCSPCTEVVSDDIKVKFNDRGKIVEAGKNVPNNNTVSAGLVIVRGKESSMAFRKVLDKAARREDFLNYDKTWHSFIKDLADAGIDIEPLMVAKSEWAEVDIHFDLQELQNLLKNKITFSVKSE